MTLSSGTKLGPFEILAPVGAGGMGEVYKAKDTRLDRTVAIKVLPPHLSSDPQIKQRFEREARAISSLSHPHICTLYDVGEHDGTSFLVMEFLEGQTLGERLRKSALPLEEVLQYGIQIADALDKAHRSGIVHRDLKPGNIMLTKAGVKLLDFGLAKLKRGAGESAYRRIGEEADSPACRHASTPIHPNEIDPSAATVKEDELTKEGTILGTLSYMAPEQLEGKEVDARTDIFAFGVVLYEMVTGKKAFTGKSQASLIAAILEREPEPISKLQPLSPPGFERVVKRCLVKEPDARWQTALDLKEELKWIAEGSATAGLPAPIVARRKNRERMAWALALVAALLVGAAMAVVGVLKNKSSAPPGVVRLSVPLPDKFVVQSLAISPDGRNVALAGQDASGKPMLWVRPLDSPSARPLPGTEGASYPFWSPDSRFIGFFADGKLKKIEASGGPPLTVCNASNGRGGLDGKRQISTSGGTMPRWSRDGKEIFFLAPDNRLMAAKVNGSGDALEVGQIHSLFQIRPWIPRRPYDVAADGQKFLVNAALEQTNSLPVTVVLNWAAELKKK